MRSNYSYSNPWHDQTLVPGPKMYVRNCPPPELYGAFEIYRIHDRQFDVVKDGACLTQRSSLAYAKEFIDNTVSGF